MKNGPADDIRPEVPSELIRSGERGKYAGRYREGANIVLIDPELQQHYPDSEAVNQALREHLACQTHSE